MEGSTLIGSLGLYVRDRLTDNLYAMTCFHCVLRTLASEMIVSPAACDLEDVQMHAREALFVTEERLRQLIGLGDLRNIHELEGAIMRHSRLLKACKRDCRLGTVYKHVQSCIDRE